MIRRFRTIIPGKLYRGSAPSVKDVVKLKHLFGIKKIVSLDEQSGDNIKNICKILKINHVMMPLDGSNKAIINLFSHDLKKLLLDDGPTFIHCKEGKDRTGFVVAAFKCKYLGYSLKEALDEALSLGFGIGVNPEYIKNMLNALKRICVDDNSADDIVSNTREYIDDPRSSALDSADRKSFAPYLSETRQYPYDNLYNYLYDQEPSRKNMEVNLENITPELNMPLVGLYDNMSGMKGVGPVEIGNGFLIL